MLLEIKNLRVYFPVCGGKLYQKKIGDVKAVDGVSLSVRKREILGLVGESGCGKTTLAKAVIGLIEGASISGQILFDGKEEIDRKRLQIIFQDPYLSTNSRMRICDIIAEGIDVHRLTKDKKERTQRVVSLMETMGLENPKNMMYRYPIELSAGQRQRVTIARALAVNPEFLICDEPVSALDVSVQDEILKLLLSLRDKFGLAILFITHDLAVVEQISDKVAIMYLGKIVEYAKKDEFFKKSFHPYTKLLLSSVPVPDPGRARGRERMEKGEILVSAEHIPSGCRFHPRCPLADERCKEIEPELVDEGGEHFVACHLSTSSR